MAFPNQQEAIRAAVDKAHVYQRAYVIVTRLDDNQIFLQAWYHYNAQAEDYHDTHAIICTISPGNDQVSCDLPTKQRTAQDLKHKIASSALGTCDCCGQNRITVTIPLFNRMLHTAWLCSACVHEALTKLHTAEYNTRA